MSYVKLDPTVKVENSINKSMQALNEARENLKKNDYRGIAKISNGNAKMGSIPSVSTLPLITCPAVCKSSCGADCYAARDINRKPNVLNSYAYNTALALDNMDLYFSSISIACAMFRFFRWHVSGDIINKKYFCGMVTVANNNPHCEFLAFTKRYNVVNDWIAENGELPKNLHIIFSGWFNLEPVNPYNLPVTNVFDNENPPAENWLVCGGNCTECICRGVGCWQLKKGDVLGIKKH